MLMIEQKIKSLPIRSFRMKGVDGIIARREPIDPAFNVDGLPNPFNVYFPVQITNIYSQTIYVTARLVNPPSGWTDSEQDLATITPGASVRTEKNNATRNIPSTPSSESITVRFNYRTGSYAGTIIGYDDFVFTIYWESVVNGGIIDKIDDFETDFEGWTASGVDLYRISGTYVHGNYSLLVEVSDFSSGYISKSVVIGSGSRAYLFGFYRRTRYDYCSIDTITSPVDKLTIAYSPVEVWRRFGVRLVPGSENTVTISFNNTTNYLQQVWFDYLQWVHFP